VLKETPYWWDSAAPAALPPASLQKSVDVAVIGGGYTGLAAALRLASGGARVAVLEKESVGWGASSRNGGQVLTGFKVGASELVERFGRERAREMFRFSLDAIAFVEALVRSAGIDCGFRRSGHLDAAWKPAHFERMRREADLLARDFGHEVRLLDRAQQAAELGSDLYHGLMLDEHSACLHPARYVRGLAAAAAAAGAAILEGTPVLRVRRKTAGFQISTGAGVVEARDVVVATNGYTDAAAPALRRRVVPIGSYIVGTAPLPAELARRLLPRDRVVFDSKEFLYYFRLTEDRRLLFGGRAQFLPSTPSSTRTSAAILRHAMLEVFPGLQDVELEYAWSGNVCFTLDRLPRAGVLEGVHFAMGYGGHGVALASFLGDLVARRLLGEKLQDPLRDLAFPPIPLYEGRPWFLPLAGAFYRLKDWLR
jgi:glycine/D-amino acid oxidase-like deaminating enzyme